ncbi:MAG: tripartite tricarboxylate transporter substrate binding protein [Lachnospiraceae bacterium]|nr:tripartite tricarboxylate transporter substrate binding protein [Lachnospiraceae bacterium]
MMKKLLALVLAAAMVLPVSAAAVQADTEKVWPKNTVTLTVPASPGGGTDTAARIFADYLQKTTGEAFNVVNDTTGGNTVAVQNARRAKTDGSEILFFHVSTLMNYYQGKLDFNPAEELTVICSLGTQASGALCASADAPYKTGEELIAYAKENPGKIRAGVTMGGNSQAMLQCFADDVGIELTLVDAGNEADWITAIMAGTIDVAFLTPATASQYIESGKFQALIAGCEEEDTTNWPGIQTMGELGGKNIWVLEMYMFGPKDMDEDVVNAICETMEGFAADEEANATYETTMKNAFTFKNHEDATASYLEKAEIAKNMSAAMGFDVSGK